MKKIFLLSIIFGLAVVVLFPAYISVQAAENTGISATDNKTLQEEAEGKAIFEKLQSKQTKCADLSDDDFEKLGDYYMGQMMGVSHSAMDTLMDQRIGEDNNRLMHIALGKRFSGCDTSAAFPSQGNNFLPMMGMMNMMGGSAPSYNYKPNDFNSMMGNYNDSYYLMRYGGLRWLPMIFWWILFIIGIILLARWATGKSRSNYSNRGETAMDILKGRYAKGEIDKKEFEEKKKDLND